MPSERTSKFLLDIRDNIDKAARFVGDRSYETFRDDELVFYAVTRCLEIISEASRRLPDDLKARHPGIRWRDIASAGNIYRHEYEDVQQRLVWGTLREHLPPLLLVIERELGDA